MPQASPSTTDGIQEFYAPCPAQSSQTPQQQPMPRIQQRNYQRHVQLADIAKSTRPESHEKPATVLAESDSESFWSWMAHFMGEARVKASDQGPINDTSVQKTLPAGSQPSPVRSNPSTSSSMLGAAKSAALKAREAEHKAEKDLTDYKVDRYSLWGEVSYIRKSMKLKRAKKKAEVATRNQRKAAQRAREKRTRQQSTGRPDAANEAQWTPRQPPTPLHSISFPLEPPNNVDPIPPDERLPITKKPTPAFSKNEGAVAKHVVEITRIPELHQSVHLTKTSANNYLVDEEADSTVDHKWRLSNATTWGDFMRVPSSPSERPAQPPLPPQTPTPLATPSQTQQQSDYRKRNASAWTFTVPGEDDDLVHASQTIIPNLNLNLKTPPTITDRRPNSKAFPDPHVCGLCGMLNSPKTHYNAQGIWLCTACRSPTSAKEFPPPPATPRKIPKRYRTRSGPRSSMGKSSTRRDEDEAEEADDEESTFTTGHFSEPEDMRRSMKPEPLQSWHQRPQSSSSLVSPLTPNPFAHFDSSTTFAKRQSPEFQKIYANRASDTHRSSEASPKPSPPSKYDRYKRKDSTASSLHYDYDYDVSPPPSPATTITPTPTFHAPFPSSNPFTPPPRLSSTHPTPHLSRLSFYPTSPSPSPSPPLPPPKLPLTPRTPTPNPQKTLKDRRRLPPIPPGVPSDFKFAPPPIPDSTVYRPHRSSSVYPEDGDAGYFLPALAFGGRGEGGKRDTSFYDFWKALLEERGREA